MYVTTEQTLFIFDSMVGSVLSYMYVSEICVYYREGDVEFNRFCKYILKLGKKVPTGFFRG